MFVPNILVIPDDLGDKTSVIELDADGGVVLKLSYEQLTRATSSLLHDSAIALLRKGDIVAVMIPNSIEFVVVALALLKRGLIIFPLNPALKPDQIAAVFHQIKPALLIETKANVASLDAASCGEYVVLQFPKLDSDTIEAGQLILRKISHSPHSDSDISPLNKNTYANVSTAPDPDDAAVLLLTSGSTGLPKGVSLTHRSMLTTIGIVSQAHHITDADTCMLITPLFHVSGFCTSMLLTLVTGGTLVIQPPGVPPPKFWQHLIQHRVTWFHAVPALLKILLKFHGATEFRHAEENLLRYVRCSGSPLSNDLLEEVEAVTGKPLLEIYGLTETSSAVMYNVLGSTCSRRGGTFPVPSHVELKIAKLEPQGSSFESDRVITTEVSETEIGEVHLHGPSIIKRYVYADTGSNASAFDATGFFRTGDLARYVGQDRKYIQLVGRVKEAINKGAEKINPHEVEDVITGHDDVEQSACFAAPDEEFGEDICKCSTLLTFGSFPNSFQFAKSSG